MAYKKDFNQKGKMFRPYENSRDHASKLKKKYVGTINPNKKLFTPELFIIFISILVVLFAIIFYNYHLTGMVISSNILNSYNVGDKLSGNLIFIINNGDRIPNDSEIKINLINNDQIVSSKELSFSDFFEGLLNPLEIFNTSAQICENVSVSSIIENCSNQCNNYQDCENITDISTNETVQNCTTQQNCTNICSNLTITNIVNNCTITNQSSGFYFNQTGTYSRNISDFINYDFNNSGNYVLDISTDFGNLSEPITVEFLGAGNNSISNPVIQIREELKMEVK